MRDGDFIISMHAAEDVNDVFEETIIDGKTYFHAVPDIHYAITVSVAKDAIHKYNKTLPEGRRLVVYLWIDGKFTSNFNYLTTEDGRVNSNGVAFQYFTLADNKIVKFKLSRPTFIEKKEEEEGEEIASTDEDKRGKIQIQVSEATVVVNNSPCNLPSINEDRKVNEQKKFWKQPGVLTAGGDIEYKPSTGFAKFESLKVIKNITCYYQTALNIQILKANEKSEDNLDDIPANDSSRSSKKRALSDNYNSSNKHRRGTNHSNIFDDEDDVEEEEDDEDDTSYVEPVQKHVEVIDLTLD
jgi:hypothetical protein